jgi:hypothetical protein
LALFMIVPTVMVASAFLPAHEFCRVLDRPMRLLSDDVLAEGQLESVGRVLERSSESLVSRLGFGELLAMNKRSQRTCHDVLSCRRSSTSPTSAWVSISRTLQMEVISHPP